MENKEITRDELLKEFGVSDEILRKYGANEEMQNDFNSGKIQANILTNENYFSPENNLKFMGSSQFKTFLDCQSRGYAETNGLYLREKTTALLVGSFVDAHFSNEMNLFRAQNPDIFKKDGSLKSEYLKAEQIIQRIESDRMMMEFLNGQPQKIMTGCICGVYFKIKIDVLHTDKIVDMKIMRDFESIWNGTERVDFVEVWGYDIQAAIYQEVERQNRGEYAEPLPFYLACSTKENEQTSRYFKSIKNESMRLCRL